MRGIAPGSFGARLKTLREAAGFTQEELATIAGLSVHAIGALERGERRRPHVDTVRALSAALDLTGPAREAFVGSARATVPAVAADALGGTRLPLPSTTLVGRDADIERLRQWLTDPAARLVTLLGPGGVGKTRLALALAHAVVEDRTARVRYVSLAAIRDHAFVAPAIAEALGLSEVSAADLPARTRVACGSRPTLLVLDNFEQVVDAAPVVAELLVSVDVLRVLVTSRAPLRLTGEREFLVGPLAVDTGPEVRSLADLARVPAIRLFVERVRDVRPEFRLTPANGPTVAAICRRLDALPLALELAAPWIKVLSPEDLLRRLAQDMLPERAGPRDLPERQRTMNATVAWSFRLLDPDERRAFRRLGVIPGVFPMDAAEDVLSGPEGPLGPGVVQLVSALVDRSLLHQPGMSTFATCPLYLMLDTIRAYASNELTASGERDDALEGLSRYCVREATLAAEGLVGPDQARWLDRVREDLDSYRTVLTWLIARGQAFEAADIAWRLMWFWAIRGQAVEGRRWYEEILGLAGLPEAAELRARLGAAAMCHIQGQFGPASHGLSRVLTLARRTGDADASIQAKWILGNVEHALGHQDAARHLLAGSLDGFRARNSPWGTGQALTGLACVALATNDAPQATQLLDEAASVLRSAGPWFLSLVLNMRATLAVRRGNAGEALALVRDSLLRIRELKDTFAFVYALVPLAAAAVLEGDDAWAARVMGVRDAFIEAASATFVDSSVPDLLAAIGAAETRLGPERWARAYAVGRQASIDSLLNDLEAATTRGIAAGAATLGTVNRTSAAE